MSQAGFQLPIELLGKPQMLQDIKMQRLLDTITGEPILHHLM